MRVIRWLIMLLIGGVMSCDKSHKEIFGNGLSKWNGPLVCAIVLLSG